MELADLVHALSGSRFDSVASAAAEARQSVDGRIRPDAVVVASRTTLQDARATGCTTAAASGGRAMTKAERASRLPWDEIAGLSSLHQCNEGRIDAQRYEIRIVPYPAEVDIARIDGLLQCFDGAT